MAFSIKIKGKNTFFKKAKKVDIAEVIKSLGFMAGSYNDAYVLQIGEMKENTCILYNPKCIGRGIHLDLRKFAQDNEIAISYNIPTTKTEINDFFNLAREIIDRFSNAELYNDDESYTIDSFFSQKESMVAFSLRELNQKASLNYNENDWIITTAMFPYTFSDEERQCFSKAINLDEFENRLHKLQLEDIYYAKPNLLHEKNRDINIAVYTLTENCRSAFPLDGSNSLITIKLNTQIDKAWVRFYIHSEERLIDGYYDYHSFIEFAKEKSKEYFDKAHIVIPEMNKEEMMKMAYYLKENGNLVI